ncbi:hypothetical protein [Paenibacillus wynnii]|uniref:Uncharacterized protein n=1 Tax=Paenibacillus wynnii TaxID=268407 RepID=A0A098M261_9BACL|nr:hypothetical protein [Paenibacillus wynnii]KGE16245.1 hypothetical protein PWYN_15910 [Paenibacillus wynnii]
MSTQTLEWNSFFGQGRRIKPAAAVLDINKLSKEVKVALCRRETVIKVAGITLLLLIGLPGTSHAATATGIDIVADKLYKKLLNVGKWVIIIKGGIDTIQNAVQGDLQASKKNFLGYLLVYIVLWALPWGLKQVDIMFADLGA